MLKLIVSKKIKKFSNKINLVQINISLECTDKSRPSDVNWVETMKAKHE